MGNRTDSKKVFVGLSGGVDSSVSAALLQREGHDVTGVFIKVWQPDFLPCTWQEDRHDAMRVCAHLGIPFLTLDLAEIYKRDVVDYMIGEYKKGRTPNPDIMCNRSVKFGAYLHWAVEQGVDAIATGHYAQIYGEESAQLYTSVDENKDQTYFLWTLKTKNLPQILFPVGGLQKRETRARALDFGLPTAQKKESQGLCFLGKLDMKEFLAHFIEKKEGKVVTSEGEVVGVHRGAVFYTLGERHGFQITARGIHDPLYVIAKDLKKNILIVSPNPLGVKPIEQRVELVDVNWIGNPPIEGKDYLARIRHRGEFTEVQVHFGAEETTYIGFKKRPPFLSAGQSLVLYESEFEGAHSVRRCVGGGIIK